MATGNNISPNFLWRLRIKINTPDGGLNQMFQLAETIEENAITRATDICTRLKAIMPSTCEIYHAALSKSNRKKDSRMLPSVIGPGLFGQDDADADETTYNRFDDAVLMRFEDADGSGITYKIGPVPDTFIVAGNPAAAVASVTDPTGAVPATAAQPVVYQTELKNLVHTIAKYCHHVETKENIPGGSYTFTPFTKVHFRRIGKKKGGRVFVK